MDHFTDFLGFDKYAKGSAFSDEFQSSCYFRVCI